MGGADVILVPSRFSNCAADQLYGLKYGTLPLVRVLVGLLIRFLTVLLRTLQMASPVGLSLKIVMPGRCYELFTCFCTVVPLLWRFVQRQAMAMDFSWQVAAKSYRELYYRLK
ncbi:hypothetical protein ACLB1E_08500 [Escherichia coli]